jgi:hypothetical protein
MSRAKSSYADKQGRPREGNGGRSRYAPTSPLSHDYRVNPSHRLAEYHARGEALCKAAERPDYRDGPRRRVRPARW